MQQRETLTRYLRGWKWEALWQRDWRPQGLTSDGTTWWCSPEERAAVRGFSDRPGSAQSQGLARLSVLLRASSRRHLDSTDDAPRPYAGLAGNIT